MRAEKGLEHDSRVSSLYLWVAIGDGNRMVDIKSPMKVDEFGLGH